MIGCGETPSGGAHRQRTKCRSLTPSPYDYTAWGEPIRRNGLALDGRWFGAIPETVVAFDGRRPEALIPTIHDVIENDRFRAYGD
jgi:hypothetical protein